LPAINIDSGSPNNVSAVNLQFESIRVGNTCSSIEQTSLKKQKKEINE